MNTNDNEEIGLHCTLAKNGTNKLPGDFGTIKLPAVRLNNSGEKFTKKFGVVCTFLKDWKKLEPINCRGATGTIKLPERQIIGSSYTE